MHRICNILVVDGHDSVRILLGQALKTGGYQFTLASNGIEMRQALDGAAHDIALIDISLRGEDGFVLADEAGRRGLQVILTTADRSKFEAVERSGVPYVLKPFQIPELLEKIGAVLKSAAADCVRRKRAAH
jgi:two-component system OmpR family response regulator